MAKQTLVVEVLPRGFDKLAQESAGVASALGTATRATRDFAAQINQLGERSVMFRRHLSELTGLLRTFAEASRAFNALSQFGGKTTGLENLARHLSQASSSFDQLANKLEQRGSRLKAVLAGLFPDNTRLNSYNAALGATNNSLIVLERQARSTAQALNTVGAAAKGVSAGLGADVDRLGASTQKLAEKAQKIRDVVRATNEAKVATQADTQASQSATQAIDTRSLASQRLAKVQENLAASSIQAAKAAERLASAEIAATRQAAIAAQGATKGSTPYGGERLPRGSAATPLSAGGVNQTLGSVVQKSKEAQAEADRFAQAWERAGRGMRSASGEAHNFFRNLLDIKNIAAVALGNIVAITSTEIIFGFRRLVGRVVEAASAMQDYVNKIKLVAAATENISITTGKLFTIADKTRSSFEGTVELYTRLARSTENLGLSQERLLRITETVNKATIISGANPREAQQGLIQLAQGIASNRLSGDEFRSISEQLPEITKIIADSLGVTRGELRKLSQEGKLTADVIITAFEAAADSVDENFGKTTQTIGQSFTRLKNAALLEVFQRLDQIAKPVNSTVEFLIDNIDDLIIAFIALAKALAGLTFIFLVSQFAQLITQMTAVRTAMRAIAIFAPRVGGAMATMGVAALTVKRAFMGLFGSVSAVVGVLTIGLVALDAWFSKVKQINSDKNLTTLESSQFVSQASAFADAKVAEVFDQVGGSIDKASLRLKLFNSEYERLRKGVVEERTNRDRIAEGLLEERLTKIQDDIKKQQKERGILGNLGNAALSPIKGLVEAAPADFQLKIRFLFNPGELKRLKEQAEKDAQAIIDEEKANLRLDAEISFNMIKSDAKKALEDFGVTLNSLGLGELFNFDVNLLSDEDIKQFTQVKAGLTEISAALKETEIEQMKLAAASDIEVSIIEKKKELLGESWELLLKQREELTTLEKFWVDYADGAARALVVFERLSAVAKDLRELPELKDEAVRSAEESINDVKRQTELIRAEITGGEAGKISLEAEFEISDEFREFEERTASLRKEITEIIELVPGLANLPFFKDAADRMKALEEEARLRKESLAQQKAEAEQQKAAAERALEFQKKMKELRDDRANLEGQIEALKVSNEELAVIEKQFELMRSIPGLTEERARAEAKILVGLEKQRDLLAEQKAIIDGIEKVRSKAGDQKNERQQNVLNSFKRDIDVARSRISGEASNDSSARAIAELRTAQGEYEKALNEQIESYMKLADETGHLSDEYETMVAVNRELIVASRERTAALILEADALAVIAEAESRRADAITGFEDSLGDSYDRFFDNLVRSPKNAFKQLMDDMTDGFRDLASDLLKELFDPFRQAMKNFGRQFANALFGGTNNGNSDDSGGIFNLFGFGNAGGGSAGGPSGGIGGGAGAGSGGGGFRIPGAGIGGGSAGGGGGGIFGALAGGVNSFARLGSRTLVGLSNTLGLGAKAGSLAGSVGAALGGAAFGFMGGSMLSNLLGLKGTGKSTLTGAATGAGLGFTVGGPVGAAVGAIVGAIAGAIKGLLGNKNARATFDFTTGNLTNTQDAKNSKNIRNERRDEVLNTAIPAIKNIIELIGADFISGLGLKIENNGDKFMASIVDATGKAILEGAKRKPDDISGVIADAIKVTLSAGIKGGDPTLLAFAKSGAAAGLSAEELVSDLQKLKGALDFLKEPVSQYQEALKGINDAFVPIIEKMKSLKQPVDELEKAFAEALQRLRDRFVKDMRDAALAITDPLVAAFNELIKIQDTRIKDAKALGGEETLDAAIDLNLAELDQFLKEATAGIDSFTESLNEFTTNETVETINDFKDQFAKLIEAAKEAGNSIESNVAYIEQQLGMALDKAREAFDQSISDEILGIDNPIALQLKQILLEQKQAIEVADALGANVDNVLDLTARRISDLIKSASSNPEAIIDLAEGMAHLLDVMQEMTGSIDPVIEAFERAQEKIVGEFNKNVTDRILAITQPTLQQFKTLLQAQRAELDIAKQIGADLLLLAQAQQMERKQFIDSLSDDQLAELGDFLGLIENTAGKISAVVEVLNNALDQQIDKSRDLQRAAEDLAGSFDSAAKDIRATIDSINERFNLGPPGQRLDGLKQQLQSAFESAQQGDLEALKRLPGLSDKIIDQSRELFGGTEAFQNDLNFVLGILEQSERIAAQRAAEEKARADAILKQVDLLTEIRDLLRTGGTTPDALQGLLAEIDPLNTLVVQNLAELISLLREGEDDLGVVSGALSSAGGAESALDKLYEAAGLEKPAEEVSSNQTIDQLIAQAIANQSTQAAATTSDNTAVLVTLNETLIDKVETSINTQRQANVALDNLEREMRRIRTVIEKDATENSPQQIALLKELVDIQS